MTMRYIKGLAFATMATSAAVSANAQTPVASASSSASSAPSAIPSEMMARYAHAKWTYPGSDQMANMYPGKAQDERVEGTVKIVCAVAADGYLDKCAVLEETPKDYGFGVATATAFVKYAHVSPATVSDGIRPGDYKTFIYKWLLG